MVKMVSLVAMFSSSLSSFAEVNDGEKTNGHGSFSEAHAVEFQDQYRMHVGLNLGVNSPRGAIDASPEMGLNVGFQPFIPFGLGGEISTSHLDGETRRRRTTLLAQGTYNLAGDLPIIRHSYMGVGTGPMFVSGNNTVWALAPLAGFDIPLTGTHTQKAFSLGLDVKYLLTSKTPNSLVSNASLKYWF